MSDADVTRGGQEDVRPGREARTWSSGGGRRAGPHDHPDASYYGRPVIKEPTWEALDIAGYLFTGGLAGASSILALGADLTGRPRMARACGVCAAGSIGVSLVALIHDLGRPERFLHMLRVFKPTSPMSVGTWILVAYAPLASASAASDVLGVAPRVGRSARVGAGLLGAAVATYTAALVGNTAVPTWQGARRQLPFLFAGSAASAASGFALLAAPLAENAPARRMAALGTLVELAAEHRMESALGVSAETLQRGTAGTRLRAARLLAAVGAIGATTVARRSRPLAAASGAALLASSALTRFGLFEAGVASARDPRYTVEPQRERLEHQ
jgi:formate-dependent nitrite reductase membrane component NrfD